MKRKDTETGKIKRFWVIKGSRGPFGPYMKLHPRSEMDALLAAPDLSQWAGRRDHAMLLTLYNSGARVSEITSLERHQVHFGVSSFLQINGKGRKERSVPLWAKTARILQSWLCDFELSPNTVVFPNSHGRALSRHGIHYILQQALDCAANNCPSLRTKRIFPHLLRHTTAMHLLQAGVDISVIALWLGHESIQTTHMYVEADLATKERALEKLAPAGRDVKRFKASDTLLTFLASLWLCGVKSYENRSLCSVSNFTQHNPVVDIRNLMLSST